MEIALVILAVIVVVVFARKRSRPNQPGNRTVVLPNRTVEKARSCVPETVRREPQDVSPLWESTPAARPLPAVAAAAPKPFDPQTAHKQQFDTAVSGSAYVIDGDTIVIKKMQIRLFGVDAPELEHPFGKKAKWALVKLCKGQTVHAQVLEKDDYGRTVAKCWLPDGRDLSAEMVRLGMAIDWPKYSGGKYTPLETVDARKKLWLADARQKGRMHVWRQFEARNASK